MIDLASAYELFEASSDNTVGIEEEFAIVDPQSFELVPMFEQLRDSAANDSVLKESVAGELISSEIEIRSGAGSDFSHALQLQRECRRRLFSLASTHGVRLAATGTHALSDYRDQQIIDTPHYQRVQDELRYVAWRNNTFSLHVHVGVQGADRAVQVCDRLRPILPLLLALSANSPFVDGADSGLHSARTQIFTKSFPRCGVPDHFGSWQNWANYVELLVRTQSIVEFTQLWWSVRPHHSFGTVEVRICDAQSTATESNGLAQLIAACVRQAMTEIDSGLVGEPIPARLIEENMWRAIRHGLDGQMLDLQSTQIKEFPSAEIAERLMAWTGVEVELPTLNGAQRQRRMIADGASPREVFARCISETETTYFKSEETVS